LPQRHREHGGFEGWGEGERAEESFDKITRLTGLFGGRWGEERRGEEKEGEPEFLTGLTGLTGSRKGEKRRRRN
jgi:hypothetical protein